MKKVLMMLCAVMLVFGMVGSASAISIEIADFDSGHTFLNFDELSDNTILDTEYAALGVTFSGTTGNDGTGSASSVYVVNSIGAYSSPNYIGQPQNRWNGSIILTFSGFVTQVGGVLIEANSWLTAYDAEGNSIDEVHWAYSGDQFDDFVGIDSQGIPIAYAIFSGNFYAVDDVRFNSGSAPVPEPSTILLMGVGLIGIAGYGRKRLMKKS